MEISIHVDDACGTDLNDRQSISGMVTNLNGTSVKYYEKQKINVSLRSSKAEFIAAVSALKISKHLRYIIQELGFHQKGSKYIFYDNTAAIMI